MPIRIWESTRKGDIVVPNGISPYFIGRYQPKLTQLLPGLLLQLLVDVPAECRFARRAATLVCASSTSTPATTPVTWSVWHVEEAVFLLPRPSRSRQAATPTSTCYTTTCYNSSTVERRPRQA